MKKPKPNLPITPQAQMIVNAWAEITRATLSPARVTAQLAMLEEWEREKAKDLERKIPGAALKETLMASSRRTSNR